MERPWLAHYEEPVAKTVAVPEQTIPDVFDEAVRLYPRNPADIFFGRRLTYDAFQSDIWRAP